VHSLEPELQALHADGLLDDLTASRSVALERGDLFSLYAEVRLILYTGVLLVTTGVGRLVARNLERIGPLSIVLALAAAALACGIPALRARLAKRELSAPREYLLLLGGLIVSADLGYAEHVFGWLGPLWSWHLLGLAVFQAVVAYAFSSSLVLAASLTALCAWFGVGPSWLDHVGFLAYTAPAFGQRAVACAALIAGWRHVDQRRAGSADFRSTFDQFAINTAFIGALAWCERWPWLLLGLPLLGVLATFAIRHALATGRESYAIYGVLYTALGICIAVVPRLHDLTAAAGFALLVVAVAAATLWRLHARVRRKPA
jgi:hypothetical protein